MRASSVIRRLLELMEVAGGDVDVVLNADRFHEDSLESACFELRWVDPVLEEQNAVLEEQNEERCAEEETTTEREEWAAINEKLLPRERLQRLARTYGNNDIPETDDQNSVRHYRPGTQVQVISVF